MADLNKIIDELSKLTVVEAADLSKQLEEKWGVTAAAPVAAAPAAGGDAAKEEQSEFSVFLTSAGDKNDRRLPLPQGEHGRGALGKDPSDLSIRADLHRGDLHLAHGTHGLCSVRAPPALACLRRHSGQLGRRLHAYPRLRNAGRLGGRAHILRPDRHRVLDHRPSRPTRSGPHTIAEERGTHRRTSTSRGRRRPSTKCRS